MTPGLPRMLFSKKFLFNLIFFKFYFIVVLFVLFYFVKVSRLLKMHSLKVIATRLYINTVVNCLIICIEKR